MRDGMLSLEIGLDRVYPIVDSDGHVYRWVGDVGDRAARVRALAAGPVVKAAYLGVGIGMEDLVTFRVRRARWVDLWRAVLVVAEARAVQVVVTRGTVGEGGGGVVAGLGDGVCGNPECADLAWKAGLCPRCYGYRRRHGGLPVGREYERLLMHRDQAKRRVLHREAGRR